MGGAEINSSEEALYQLVDLNKIIRTDENWSTNPEYNVLKRIGNSRTLLSKLDTVGHGDQNSAMCAERGNTQQLSYETHRECTSNEIDNVVSENSLDVTKSVTDILQELLQDENSVANTDAASSTHDANAHQATDTDGLRMGGEINMPEPGDDIAYDDDFGSEIARAQDEGKTPDAQKKNLHDARKGGKKKI